MKKKNLIISLVSGGGLVGTGATTAGVLVTNKDKITKNDDQVIIPVAPTTPEGKTNTTQPDNSSSPKQAPILPINLNLIDYQRIQEMLKAREEAESNDLHQKALNLIAAAEESNAKAYNLAVAQSLAKANKNEELEAIKASSTNHWEEAWSKAKLANAQEFQVKRAEAEVARVQWLAAQDAQTAQYNQSVFGAKSEALSDAKFIIDNEALATNAEKFVSNEESQAAAFIAAYNDSVKAAREYTQWIAMQSSKTEQYNQSVFGAKSEALSDAKFIIDNEALAATAAANAEKFVSNEENQAAAFIAAYNNSVKDAKLETLKTAALNHAIDAWSKAKLANAQEFQVKRADAAVATHNEEAAANAEKFVSNEENQAAAFIAAYNNSVKDAKLETLKTAALNHAIDAWSKAKLANAQEFQVKRADAAVATHNEEAAANAEKFVSNEENQAAAFIAAYNNSVKDAKLETLKTAALNHAIDVWSKAKLANAQEFQVKRAEAEAARAQWLAAQDAQTAQYNQSVFGAKSEALSDAKFIIDNEALAATAAANAEKFVSNEENQAAAFIAAYNNSVKDAKLETLKTAALNHAIDAWSKAKLANAQEFQVKRADAAVATHNEEAAANAEKFVSNEENQAAAFIAAYNNSVKDAKLETLKTAALNHAIDEWSKAKLANAQEFQVKRADAAVAAHNEEAAANAEKFVSNEENQAAAFIAAYNDSVKAAREYTQWIAMQNSKTAQYNQSVFDAKSEALSDAKFRIDNEALAATAAANAEKFVSNEENQAAAFIDAYNNSVKDAKLETLKTAALNHAIDVWSKAKLANAQEFQVKRAEAEAARAQWVAAQDAQTAQYNQSVFGAKYEALANAKIDANNANAEAAKAGNELEMSLHDAKYAASETIARNLSISLFRQQLREEAAKLAAQEFIVTEQVTAANNSLNDYALVNFDIPGSVYQLNKTVVTSIPYANGEIEAATIYNGFESTTTVKVFEGKGNERHEITNDERQLTLRIAERINQEITVHSNDVRQAYNNHYNLDFTSLENSQAAHMKDALEAAIKANTFTPINPNWKVVFSSTQSDGGPQLASALNDLVSYRPKNVEESKQWISTMAQMIGSDRTPVTINAGSNLDLIFKNNNKHGSSILDPNSFNNLWSRLQDQNIRSQIRNFMQANKTNDFTENVLAITIYLDPNGLSHAAMSNNIKQQLDDAISKVNAIKPVEHQTTTQVQVTTKVATGTKRVWNSQTHKYESTTTYKDVISYKTQTSTIKTLALTSANKATVEKAISYLNDYSSWSASTIFNSLKNNLKNVVSSWLTYSPSQADKTQIDNWISQINAIKSH